MPMNVHSETFDQGQAGRLAQASGIDSIYKCLSAQVLNPGRSLQ